MMNDSGGRSPIIISPWVMLISAAIFGYFGFSPQFNHTGQSGQFLLFVAIYEYTLKGSAIAFLLSAGVAFVQPVIGSVMYGISGLLSAAGLIVAGVLDLLDTQHTVQDPLLTFLFAAIILFVAIASLRDVLTAARRRPAGRGESTGTQPP